MKIAVLSSNGEYVDLHVGKGESAYLYNDLEFLEHRNIDIDIKSKHQGFKVLEALNDCDAIIAQDFGFKTKENADSKGIILYRFDGSIKNALNDFLSVFNQ